MEQLIAKMRADWPLIAESRRATGDWTEQDEQEIGAAIKAAVDSKDAAVIAMWARWLADLSAWCCAWRLIVRGSEAAMRAKAIEHKASQQGKA